MEKQVVKQLLNSSKLNETEKKIADKILENQRIIREEALYLFEKTDLDFLSLMATYVKQKLNGNKVYFNNNIHIEPTNICVYNCKFCSFKRRPVDSDSWNYSNDYILEIVSKYKNTKITEIHITGGVHPKYDLHNFCNLFRQIKEIMPKVHLKAFTAIEIDYLCQSAGVSYAEGLQMLKNAGLDSLPGGGAEIFDPEVRRKIAYEKSSGDLWIEVHKTAHKLGIPSNATMLYGHIENFEHRIDHLDKLRLLQDQTHGFNAFIPLKFKNYNNSLSNIPELSILDDMRNYAVTRIMLDNIPHLKFYWVNLGRKYAQTALNFGVDDLDGTINNTTKIYTMAGSDEQNPTMSDFELIELITSANQVAVERDSIYHEINSFFPTNTKINI